MRAVKLQKRTAEVGFDWPSLAPVFAKAEEEIAELKAAIDSSGNDAGKPPAKEIGEEFGDLLFVMANIARISGSTLKRACATQMRNSPAASRA
jgi:uncharacterized protein YabN with tetrapyrrole methylase and pyrophosphatase domain